MVVRWKTKPTSFNERIGVNYMLEKTHAFIQIQTSLLVEPHSETMWK
jgi:hypothetical protein